MSKLRELKPRIMEEGQDLVIDDADFALIREQLPADGPLADDDMRMLVEMRTEARKVCPAFDEFFFPRFKGYLLADGVVSHAEQFQLLRMLYGGGGIDAAERQFLIELKKEAREVTPEFDALYRQAISEVFRPV